MSDKAWEVVDQRAIVTQKKVSNVLNDIVLDWASMRKQFLKIKAEKHAQDIKKAKVIK